MLILVAHMLVIVHHEVAGTVVCDSCGSQKRIGFRLLPNIVADDQRPDNAVL
jgi:hypothetical protein